MPSDRLILCGLLSKYPEKSTVAERILAQRRDVPQFTDAQKMHIVATYWTPELSKPWIYHQFIERGMPWNNIRTLFERYAYNPVLREKYTPIGQRNLLFIGPNEVLRYYHRHPKDTKVQHPTWALPVIYDERKRGLKIKEIAEKYNLTPEQVAHILYRRSMFETSVKRTGGNPEWTKKGKQNVS